MLMTSISKIFTKSHKINLTITKLTKLAVIKHHKMEEFPPIETTLKFMQDKLVFNLSFTDLKDADKKNLRDISVSNLFNFEINLNNKNLNSDTNTNNLNNVNFVYFNYANKDKTKPTNILNLFEDDLLIKQDLILYNINIKFTENLNLNLIQHIINPANFESKVKTSNFNYETNKFESPTISDLKFYLIRDFRLKIKLNPNLKIFNELNDVIPENYLVVGNMLNRIHGDTQFFVDKNSKSFVFIDEGDASNVTEFNRYGLRTTKIVFEDGIKFLSFVNIFVRNLDFNNSDLTNNSENSYVSKFCEDIYDSDSDNCSDNNSDVNSDSESNLDLNIENNNSCNNILKYKLNENHANKLINTASNNLFVSDGKDIGVFNINNADKIFGNANLMSKNKTILKNVGNNLQKFQITHDSDNMEQFYILDSNKNNRNEIKRLDLEKQKITDEIKTEKEVMDLFGELELSGISNNSVFKVDTRGGELVNLKEYKGKVDFGVANSNLTINSNSISCNSNLNKLYAIGSNNGDVRIYTKLGNKASVHLKGLNSPVKYISIRNKMIAVTYKTYIMLITTIKTWSISKIITKRLSLNLNHSLIIGNTNFSKATISESGDEVITSSDEFIISWDISDLKDLNNFNNTTANTDINSKIKKKDEYYINKYDDKIVNECIKNDKVYILMGDKIQIDELKNYKRL